MGSRRWIEGDENAKEMLARVLRQRPFLLLPPLHRVPLRNGNVVEIVGPSHSAKTQILIQAAVNCILPKDWNDVHYGGLEVSVMFFDLDCRFDILRLSQLLKHRIMEAKGSRTTFNGEQNDIDDTDYNSMEPHIESDKELFAACMRRFLYVRCYDSLEFLATLKTLHYQLQRERETHGMGVRFLMIDSIGAFYWIDRASRSLPLGGDKRKSFSLQSMSEAIVGELQKLLLVHPMLVLAAKTVNLGDTYATTEVNMASGKWSSHNSDLEIIRTACQKLPYREYMPAVWQSLVTHRILVRASDDPTIYLSEWLLPSQNLLDRFVVRDAGVFVIS